jgi:L-ascorbate metabolism protein UlaG (beta-lactamase superfamily)
MNPTEETKLDTSAPRGEPLVRSIDRRNVPAGGCTAWWLGQHGFVFKFAGAVCYVDAFLTPGPGRRVAPLLAPRDVAHATLVLGSHDHSDHIDRPAWPGLAAASPGAVFVVPEALRTRVARELGLDPGRVRGVDVDRPLTVGGVTVHGVPAAHEFLDRDPATGLHPYLGFVLEADGVALYHAGDTCLYEGIWSALRRWRLSAAFLPINGRDARRLAAKCIGNMTYQEAADLAGALRPGLTVPTHFEMFASNSEDPKLFEDYMRVKYPALAVHVPRHGEPFDLATGR